MSYSFYTSSTTGKNGLLNQSAADQYDIDIQTRNNASTFVGYLIPQSISGSSNILIGFECGLYATEGNSLIFIGNRAGSSNGGSINCTDNVFIGHRSGEFNAVGGFLTYIGNDSGRSNTDGFLSSGNVTAVGYKSAYKNIGYENVFVGHMNNYTEYSLYTNFNTSIGNYSVARGSNVVQCGFSNYNQGSRSISIGTNIWDCNNNNIVLGNKINNFGRNCLILKTNHTGTFENRENNYINIQDRLVGSNDHVGGGYVLNFYSDIIRFETSDGNSISIGGYSNSVTAVYYSVTAQQFDINAPTKFMKSILFDGPITTSCNVTANGSYIFNSNTTFNAPEVHNASITINGDTKINGSTAFVGSITMSNSLVSVGNWLQTGQTTFSNSVEGNGTFIQNGIASFTNLTTFNNNVLMNSNLTCSEDVIMKNKIILRTSNIDWFIYNEVSSEDSDLVFQSSNSRITFTDNFSEGLFNFTGSHRCSIATTHFDKEKLKTLLGRIVISNGSYKNLENKNIIEVDEAIPVVELSYLANDKRVFGVISGFEDTQSSKRFFKIGNIQFDKYKSKGEVKVIVNSVGEGAIKVCDYNGNFENGDLITTCPLEGYGSRQMDDIIRNYTIAKITTSINWDDPILDKKFLTGNFVDDKNMLRKWALIGCIYLC